MNFKLLNWLKGYVVCSLRGRYIELFINMVIDSQLNIWNIGVDKNNRAIFAINLQDFFKLKPILKKTYTRISVEERVGLPFLLKRLTRRKGLLIGISLFLILIYFFSSMIWTISIEGNRTIKTDEILESVNEIGVHRGTLKFRLPPQKEIQDLLQNQLRDEVSWVGVNIDGTNLTITIVEKVKPDNNSYSGPRNIVSNKNAIIHKIYAEKGIPQVKVNDRVKKGDVLISGIIGDEENQNLVAAKGTVEGVVWYESNATISLKQQWKEYTGEYIERNYIGIGNRMIKYKGYKDITFEKYQKKYDIKRLTWRNYQIPVAFITERILEYNERSRILTVPEALEVALDQSNKNLFAKIDSESKILSKKVLNREIKNGKLSIKILYEVLEDITRTQPIIQGD